MRKYTFLKKNVLIVGEYEMLVGILIKNGLKYEEATKYSPREIRNEYVRELIELQKKINCAQLY